MIRIQLKKRLHAAHGFMELDVDLQIPKGVLVVISGPSGSGKTTLLRLIAGLEKPAKGLITYGDEIWLNDQNNTFLPPQKRRIGLVYQDYALFPNMTVEKNLRYALSKGQDPATVQSLIQKMELTELAKRYPANLSGGQQQRVALARALVRKPGVLLLDEPLSALDTAMRSRLQDFILDLHRSYQLTTILVSHDFPEIEKMADTVFWLEKGRIEKQGSPAEVLGSRELILKGVVQAVSKENAKGRIHLLIGDNLVEAPVSREQISAYHPGMVLQIRWTNQGFRIVSA